MERQPGHRVKEAPPNMLWAMGIAAFLCVFLGSYPQFLYSLLPFDVEYHPYTYEHVIGQTQLLFFSAMAFTLLLLSGIYPAEMRAINLDFDWFYRKGTGLLYYMVDKGLNGLNRMTDRSIAKGFTAALSKYFQDGPARLCLAVIKPLWQMTGVKITGPDGMEAKFIQKFRIGTFTIGSVAIFSIGFLLILFLI